MDGLKRRRPDSSLDMDVEARLSEKAFPARGPARGHITSQRRIYGGELAFSNKKVMVNEGSIQPG